MYQNHYFLKHLASELNDKLGNSLLVECFSQNKDELILGFDLGDEAFYIKADLVDHNGILSFPTEFSRARKNSINLFDDLLGLTVKEVRVHQNERSFQIEFSSGHHLVFKLFGRSNNILLFESEKVSSLFKNTFQKDKTYILSDFDRNIDQSFEAFEASAGNLKNIFPTFGKIVLEFLEGEKISEHAIADQWKMVKSIEKTLIDPPFYIVIYEGKVRLSLLKVGKIVDTYDSAIKAANAFYYQFISVQMVNDERKKLVNKIEKEISKAKNYVDNSRKKADEISKRHYNQIADIIMAHLHEIKPNQGKIELLNFYTNQMIEIRLNPKLSPQKNAERYYQKNKNQDIEINKLQELITGKLKSISQLEQKLVAIGEAKGLRDLRSLDETNGTKKTVEIALPYHQFEIDGFVVLVGKNAKANDQLTLKYAHKDDLWLHARDVAGSHVVVKAQSGKNFPSPLIEKTAQLAAWFSKGRNFPLCPVIHTPKKFVRKPKGFAPGMMKVEREKVILVKPEKITN